MILRISLKSSERPIASQPMLRYEKGDMYCVSDNNSDMVFLMIPSNDSGSAGMKAIIPPRI